MEYYLRLYKGKFIINEREIKYIGEDGKFLKNFFRSRNKLKI